MVQNSFSKTRFERVLLGRARQCTCRYNSFQQKTLLYRKLLVCGSQSNSLWYRIPSLRLVLKKCYLIRKGKRRTMHTKYETNRITFRALLAFAILSGIQLLNSAVEAHQQNIEAVGKASVNHVPKFTTPGTISATGLSKSMTTSASGRQNPKIRCTSTATCCKWRAAVRRCG